MNYKRQTALLASSAAVLMTATSLKAQGSFLFPVEHVVAVSSYADTSADTSHVDKGVVKGKDTSVAISSDCGAFPVIISSWDTIPDVSDGIKNHKIEKVFSRRGNALVLDEGAFRFRMDEPGGREMFFVADSLEFSKVFPHLGLKGPIIHVEFKDDKYLGCVDGKAKKRGVDIDMRSFKYMNVDTGISMESDDGGGITVWTNKVPRMVHDK